MSSSNTQSSFGQALQFITSIKLQELEKQRLAYQAHAKVLEEANATGDDLIARVEILSNAVRSWTGSGALSFPRNVEGKLNLDNLDYWLKQAKNDPCFSRDLVGGWSKTLETHIRHSMMRFDCAKLFGNLFNEWLASGDSSTVAYQGGVDDSATDTSYEVMEGGRKEKYEQKKKLESLIFDEKLVDTDALVQYLSDLFSSDEGEKALKALREEVRNAGARLLQWKIRAVNVTQTIQGLLASGLLDEEKRATLKEFLDNANVIEEVASVLNMRLASLDTWAWPAEGILVQMRRHLNGKYRAFTDPEIVDALLLHYLGVEWQVILKRAFKNLFDSKAWNRRFAPPTHAHRERWSHQLQQDNGTGSIEKLRNDMRRQHFFLSQMSEAADRQSAYDDLVDAPAVYEDDDNDGKTLTPASTKQKLLHILTAECYLNMALYGSHAIVRSDLEWFGPSLPHASILTILGFFGVSEAWLTFFKAFLRAPLRFSGDAEVRIRQRGTPIGYALSVVCGEVILFGMDFAVNQRASGLFLHRMHDDLWIWDSDPVKCAMAWKEMNTYANLVGLKFNEKKTGSACVGKAQNEGLPVGDIRWGFLKFNPVQARFIIDQDDVDNHIAELRRQLDFTKSIFGWVNAYNKYMAFFLRNFGGRSARCFGDAHTKDIVDTLAKIQRELFPDSQNGAVGHLRSVIAERFGMADLPEGYFYFPIGNGGLELRNTMLELLALQPDENKVPAEETFSHKLQEEEESYRSMKEAWDQNGDVKPRFFSLNHQFMTFEEFASLRESWRRGWGNAYEQLLTVRKPVDLTVTPAVQADLQTQSGSSWYSLNWYNKWIVSLYGEELVNKFGGLEVVDPTLIPVGMVQLFRSSRMKLDE